jgi:tricorn protease
MIRFLLSCVVSLISVSGAFAESAEGYYRFPSIHNDTIVFVAEGDLWRVSTEGGVARRLTTHPGEEIHPAISPDGRTLAFTARYEGPAELYTMPLGGGLPTRLTYEAESSIATTWTPGGELVYTTSHFSTLPDYELVSINSENGTRSRIPLSQASEGVYNATGTTLFFVRPSYHRNVTKRYVGGTARKIWKFVDGASEAEVLTADYPGGSHTPMWWEDRVFFISDRDGTMNVWSMNESGGDLHQHTRHSGWDVRDAALHNGRIVYQSGADLWLYEIGADRTQMLSITLSSDFDQLRERWVKKPMQYLTSVHIHPKGESVVMTARGRIFVAPTKQGRRLRASPKAGVRYRDGVFMPDGDNVLVLSDESGEFEFVTLPADGVGDEKTLSDDGTILRYQGIPSPDGTWVAYDDNNRDMWLLNVESGEQKVISINRQGIGDFSWSPDSRWIAFVQRSTNTFTQIHLYNVESGSQTEITSDRFNSGNAVWSPDGQWIYFLSDRNLRSVVGSPWGSRQPEPYFDKPMKIYQAALKADGRPPFRPDDELHAASKAEETKDDKKDEDDAVTPVEIDLDGIQQRVWEVPIGPGMYNGLEVNDKALFWVSRDPGADGKAHLMAAKIGNEKVEAKKIVEGIGYFELSADGKKTLVRKGDDLYVIDADAKEPSKLAEDKVDLSGWTFAIDVREDWRQIFVDAWRMERDYFYDPGMHGVDWDGVRDKYLPLVDRVTTRVELSDLIGRFVGELSALHTSVWGGDRREGDDDITVPALGARLERDVEAGGYRIDAIYRSDPDLPDLRSPLGDPANGISEGDIIEAVNGTDTLSATHIGALLRNQQGRQVRLSIRPAAGGESRDAIVVPTDDEWSLRYHDWEYSRRLEVEEKGGGEIGYVHLRAMGSRDISAWYRDFYPVYNRRGIILDFRHNRGGNIDSIILEKLIRKAWFYWKGRVGEPYPNMQYATRGHLVALCDQNTASDGEAVIEGFRRLGLGKIIGMRTWGGEIWLSSYNRLSDGGLARAPMTGVYADGEWLIEGHGVDPDIVVDNLPHATFNGGDAQLDAAIEYLLEEIRKDPREVPPPPPYPDKSFIYPDQSPEGGQG